MTEVDHNFIVACNPAIQTMRLAGMNEALIACVLVEVRAAAIQEERLRLEALLRANPPVHRPWGDYVKAIAEWAPPAKSVNNP